MNNGGGALPNLTAFAVNNANLYGDIKIGATNAIAGTDLKTTVAGAVNTGQIKSSVSTIMGAVAP
ncbi:hypothetical protein [Azospirillum canadense]|uniref:hypothetical protein n=1 Tax=Azospirillum canadense TaxID=403962 RepID=UPI00222802CF|nr:hypothetical protein [Azospirillum canadense]MCW2241354.1 hypothetical protein [Azospirillum canadense]